MKLCSRIQFLITWCAQLNQLLSMSIVCLPSVFHVRLTWKITLRAPNAPQKINTITKKKMSKKKQTRKMRTEFMFFGIVSLRKEQELLMVNSHSECCCFNYYLFLGENTILSFGFGSRSKQCWCTEMFNFHCGCRTIDRPHSVGNMFANCIRVCGKSKYRYAVVRHKVRRQGLITFSSTLRLKSPTDKCLWDKNK